MIEWYVKYIHNVCAYIFCQLNSGSESHLSLSLESCTIIQEIQFIYLLCPGTGVATWFLIHSYGTSKIQNDQKKLLLLNKNKIW